MINKKYDETCECNFLLSCAIYDLRTVPADGGEELAEPLDLGVEGAVVPDLVAEADRVEEVEVHGGGADDGHVRALLDVAGADRLGRRKKRQAKVISCVCATCQYIYRCTTCMPRMHIAVDKAQCTHRGSQR